MYEGRNARLFHPFTGVITWMSHPAQPSFVWQLYHHDLEANAALFAVRKACEPVHIQMNENDGTVAVINNLPTALAGATARLRLFNLDGTLAADRTLPVAAAASLATNLGPIAWPAGLTPVHFVKLELTGSDGSLISDNFYWHAAPPSQLAQQPKPGPLNFLDLETMPTVSLEVSATVAGTGNLPVGLPPVRLEGGPPTEIEAHGSRCLLNVTVHNPTAHVALMAHLQLRRALSGGRVLPAFYSDNYVSLIPGETKAIAIEAAQSDLQGEPPLIAVDGWNVTVTNTPGATLPIASAPGVPTLSGTTSPQVAIVLNTNAQVDQWPRTGLPMINP
jgi:beta-mannosidase